MSRVVLLLGCVFIWWLFKRDRSWRSLPSTALWIPGLWLAIVSSRQVSFWLNMAMGGGGGGSSSNLEGSPLNIVFNGSLFLISIIVLRRRGFNWAQFASENKALFFVYGFFLCSALWSPFPLPTVKRLIQEFGCVLTGCIILTEKDPGAALRVVFVRVAYVLFPLSVIFIRYFPEVGRVVSSVSGTHMLCGVAGHKNSLGELMMVLCLVVLWDLMETQKLKTASEKKPEPWTRLFTLGIGFYLLLISSSATALLCFVFGAVMLFAGKRLTRMKNPKQVIAVAVVTVFCAVSVNKVLGVSDAILAMLGRNATLTGRTDIWRVTMEKNTHQLLGAGFRGFWETSEGESVSKELGTNMLITAHNGYLDTYLNGGLVGLSLLIIWLCSIGMKSVNKLVKGDPMGRLAIFFWPILLINNVTETAFFQLGPLWFTTLLVTLHRTWQTEPVQSVDSISSKDESPAEPLRPSVWFSNHVNQRSV